MGTGFTRHLSLDALPCAAAYVNSDGDVLTANDAFHNLWLSCVGESQASPGRALSALFVPEQRSAVGEAIVTSGSPARPSTRAARLSGVATPMLVEFVPVGGKRTAGVVWLVMLRPSHKELHQEEVIRAALTAGIFHDLRGPMQVVLGWASLLRHQHDGRRLEHALTIIEDNAKLQLDLLQDVLELSRPPWARSPPRHGPVDLAELARAVVRGLEPAADCRGVRLNLVVDAPAMVVDGDVVHLRRIMGNLIGNAVKFTPRGGTVECVLAEQAAWARIVIRDSGRGIRPEFLPRVFDAFVQDSRSIPAGDGIGLGLCVVRHLVELHGGHVTAASAGIGRGSTFTVLLPAVQRFAATAAVSA